MAKALGRLAGAAMPDVVRLGKRSLESSSVMATVVAAKARLWFRQQAIRVLSAGPVPRHVSIIMDGNRRYAEKHAMDRQQGHAQGYGKMLEALQWCLDLGVKCVTVYAFSIDNFKRSKAEVDALMDLAEQKLAELLQEIVLLEKHGVAIRVLGNLSMLPPKVQRAAARAMYATAHHKGAVLNICLAYTARNEMTAAAVALQDAVRSGVLLQSDISEQLFERCLYTDDCPPVDLLIRTSGETRLSDFLLWQSSQSCLAFLTVLWPDFSFRHLVMAIVQFQLAALQLRGTASFKGDSQLVTAKMQQFDKAAEEALAIVPASDASDASSVSGNEEQIVQNSSSGSLISSSPANSCQCGNPRCNEGYIVSSQAHTEQHCPCPECAQQIQQAPYYPSYASYPYPDSQGYVYGYASNAGYNPQGRYYDRSHSAQFQYQYPAGKSSATAGTCCHACDAADVRTANFVKSRQESYMGRLARIMSFKSAEPLAPGATAP
eukprot:jgi/Chlat1/2334/Chrsp17S02803